jgi:hypothetical protein
MHIVCTPRLSFWSDYALFCSAHFTDVYDAFTEWADDDSVELSLSQFTDGIRTIGGGKGTITDADLGGVFSSVDTDKDGMISLREFLTAFQKRDGVDKDDQSEEQKDAHKFRVPSEGNTRPFEEVVILHACMLCARVVVLHVCMICARGIRYITTEKCGIVVSETFAYMQCMSVLPI